MKGRTEERKEGTIGRKEEVEEGRKDETKSTYKITRALNDA